MKTLKNIVYQSFLVLLILALFTTATAYAGAGKNIQMDGVAAGSATIQRDGVNALIRAADGTIINFSRFDVPKDAYVNFIQPSNTARVLNRINSLDPSHINGSINANGIVYFLNPSGIMFGPHSVVNAAKFYAAAGNLSNSDFLSHIDNFTNLSGSVVNLGFIGAGSVNLLGKHVANYGSIVASKGLVTMAAGDNILLGSPHSTFMVKFNSDSKAGEAAKNSAQAGVDNQGTIKAKKHINLVAGDIYSLGVSSSGDLESKNIVVKSDKGAIKVSGTLDASGNKEAGFVETSGEKVKIADNTVIKTESASGEAGTWLIDPTDFTISAGSDPKTDSGIGADTLETNLGGNNVNIQTVGTGSEPGDIYVNAPVSWSSSNSLTLSAHNDINVNSAIKATGSGGLTLNANGGSGTINLDANITTNGGKQTYNGAVQLKRGITLDASSGNISFGSTIKGAHHLTVNTSGAINFKGAVNISKLTTGSSSTSNIYDDITTTKSQTYNGAVNLKGANTFTSGSDINLNGAISATNKSIDFEATSGDISIASGASITANDIVLNSKTFTNSGGASALSGSWTIYTKDPANNTLGNLVPDFILYGAIKGDQLKDDSGTSLTGNGLVYSLAPTLKIDGLTGSVNKIYDGNTDITLDSSNINSSGLVGGDSIDTAAGNFKIAHAGQTKLVVISNDIVDYTIKNNGAPVYGYSLDANDVEAAIGTIEQRKLNFQLKDGETISKIYNGTKDLNFDASKYELGDGGNPDDEGFVGNDGATIGQPHSVAFASTDAEKNLDVNFKFRKTNFTPDSGTDLGNYKLPTSATLKGEITPAPIYIAGLSADDKVYDGNKKASISYENKTFGIIKKDKSHITVDLSGLTGTFDSKHAGTHPIELSGFTLTTDDNVNHKTSNYMIEGASTNLSATITPKPIDITGVTLDSSGREYNGSTNAANILNLGSAAADSNEIIGTDTVNVNTGGVSAKFSQKDVGDNLKVTTSGFTLDNNDYKPIAPTFNNGKITPKQLDITFKGGSVEKTYDGTDFASLKGSDFDVKGFVSGEQSGVSLDHASGLFYKNGSSYKDAATGLDVVVDIQKSDFTVTDPDTTKMSNYVISNSGPKTYSGVGTINPVQLVGNIVGNPTKEYDGNDTATIDKSNIAFSGVVDGESITANFTGDKNGNYASSDAGTWDINNINLSSSEIAFGSGTLASNYILPSSYIGLGTITPKPIQMHSPNDLLAGIEGVTKVYDGSTDVTFDSDKLTLTGWVTGQGATNNDNGASINGNFAQKDAGKNIKVTADIDESDLKGYFTLTGGANWNNYQFLNEDKNGIVTAQGVGEITPREITVSLKNSVTRVYNGTNVANPNASDFKIESENGDRGILSGEGFSIDSVSSGYYYDSSFASKEKDVDTAKKVRVKLVPSNFTPTGSTKRGNYVLNVTVQGDGKITPAPLELRYINANSRVYDPTLDNSGKKATIDFSQAKLYGLTDTDKVGNVVSLDYSGYNANFTSKNAGTHTVNYSGVVLSGDQIDIDNYNLILPDLAATIRPYTLTLNGLTAQDKDYDGTTNATLNDWSSATLSSALGTDNVALDVSGSSPTAKFSTKDVVGEQNVSVNGFNLKNNPNGNYVLRQPDYVTAEINPASITISMQGTITKSYDGSDSASAFSPNFVFSGFAASEGEGAQILQISDAHYGNSDADKNKDVFVTINISDFKLKSGTKFTNYSFDPVYNLKDNIGEITPGIIDLTGRRVYDGTTDVAADLFTNGGYIAGVGDEKLKLVGTGTVSSKDVGTYTEDSGSRTGTNFDLGDKDVNGDKGLTLTDGDGKDGGKASNYQLVGGNDKLTITRRTLNVSFDGVNKVYDGTNAAELENAAPQQASDVGTPADEGLISGDNVNLDHPTEGHFLAGNGLRAKDVDTNKTVKGDMSISGDDAGNYKFTNDTNTADITVRHLTVSATAQDKQYDATSKATVSLSGGPTTGNLDSGVIAGDDIDFQSNPYDANFYDSISNTNEKNVGSWDVVVKNITKSGTDALNYELDNTVAVTSADITPRKITINASRVYDGTTVVDSGLYTDANDLFTTGYGGERLKLTDSGDIDTKNVGNYSSKNSGSKELDQSGFTLADDSGSGGKTANYEVFYKLKVTKRPLTDTIVAQDKDYDGTIVADLTSDILQANTGSGAGLIDGDAVTLVDSLHGTFDSKNAGTWTVTSKGIQGSDASNYAYTPGTTTATINKAAIAITVGIYDVTKVYDGTTAITNATSASDTDSSHGKPELLSGDLFGTDSFDYSSGTFTFTDKNVGTGKTVTVTGVKIIDGNNGDNYDYTYVDNTNSTINPAPLTITANDDSKTYDGLAYAGGNGIRYDGFVHGENDSVLDLSGLTYGGSAQGAIDAGDYDITASGITADHGNYDITYKKGALQVEKADLTITAEDANKTYGDSFGFYGNEYTTSGLVHGEQVIKVDLSSAGAASTADVNGSGYDIKAANAVGNNGFKTSNYNITYKNGTLTIDPLSITVTATAGDKTYNGKTGANILLGTSGVINGDTVNFTGTGNFDNANVGNGKTVNVTGITTSGADKDNYTVNNTTSTFANIFPAKLTITANNDSKTYGDQYTLTGDNTEFTTGGADGLQNGETISEVNLQSLGADKSADVQGSPYDITFKSNDEIKQSGNGFDANNYDITYVDGALTIDPASLTLTAKDANKTYGDSITFDGTEFTHSSLVAGDDWDGVTVTLGSTGASSTADVNGTGYDITISGATDGSKFKASNYDIDYVKGELTINKADLTITANDDSKIYDAIVYNGDRNGVSYSGFVNGEDNSVLGGSLSYTGDSQTAVNVGGYTITPEGLSSDNYDITFVDGGLTINKRPIEITTVDVNKTYDSTTDVTGGSAITTGFGDGLVGTDKLTGGDFAYDDPNAGNNKTVTTSNVTVNDGNSGGNYDVTYVDNTNSSIDPASLTITANPYTKTYDGSAYSGGNGVTYSTFAGSEDESVLGGTLGYTGDSQGAVDAGGYTITPGGYTSNNYTITYVDGALTIDPASLTLTAKDANKTYGQQITFDGTEFSYDPNDLASSDSLGDVTVTLGSTGASSTADVSNSPYKITISGATDGANFKASNYDIDYVKGELTIDKKDATVTANSDTVTYNGITQTVTGFTVSGLVNGEDQSVLTGLSETGGSGKDAGSYDHKLTGTDGNYELTFVDGALTIEKADATVTANSDTLVYNGAQQQVTGFTVSGLVSSDTKADLTNLSESGGKGTNVGDYGHSYSGTDGNYNLSFVDGKLTITPHDLTITAKDGSKTYGDTYSFDDANDFASTGLQGSDGIDSVTLSSAGAYSGADAGDYDIDVSGATGSSFDADNYTITYVNGTLEVDPAALTITADNVTKTYGEQKTFDGTEFDHNPSGLVNGDKLDGVTVTLGSVGASSTADVGNSPYVITISNASDGSNFKASNYNISYEKGHLTIDPKQLSANIIGTITKEYNGDDKATLTSGDYKLDGFVLGQGATVNQTSGKYNSKNVDEAATVTANLGSGDFTANTGTDLSNYKLPTSASGAGKITPATLTYVADPASREYGDNNPTFNGKVTGFVTSSENESNATSGTLTFTSPATETSDVGSYAIDGGGLTADHGNYVFVQDAGNATALTINKATLTITADNQDKTYGDQFAFIGNEFSYSGNKNGETVGSVDLASTGSVPKADVGDYDIVASNASGGNFDANNYKIEYNNGTLKVNQAKLTITAKDLSKVYGDKYTFDGDEFTTGGADGLQNGEHVTHVTLTSTGASKTATVAGSDYDIAITSGSETGDSGFKSSNYEITYKKGALTVTKRPITVTATGTNRVYDGTTDDDITLATDDLVNGDSVAFTGAGNFIDKNAGNNKIVNVTGISSTSTDANNYSFNTTATASADITKRPLTVTFNPNDKTYDGDNSAVLTGGDFASKNIPAGTGTKGLISGDDVTLNDKNKGHFDDADVAYDGSNNVTTKDVTSDMSISGADAGNYIFTNATVSSGDSNAAKITPKAIDLSGTRVYDGSPDIDANDLTISGTINGQTLILNGTGKTSNKDVNTYTDSDSTNHFDLGSLALSNGTGKADNYTFTGGTDTFEITPLSITVDLTAVNKTYDGTKDDPGATLSSGGILTGDIITFSSNTPQFDDKNAGTGKTVTAENIALGGTDRGNYTVANPGDKAIDTADITAAVIHLSGTRTYDGTTDADSSDLSNNGYVDGITVGGVTETLKLVGSGSVDDKNVGNNKDITNLGSLALLDGNNGGESKNYVIDSGELTITKANLVISTTDVIKPYDGNTSANGNPIAADGTTLFGSDTLTGGDYSFLTPAPGNGKTVTVDNVTINDGNNGGNYSVSYVPNTNSAILNWPMPDPTHGGNNLNNNNNNATSGLYHNFDDIYNLPAHLSKQLRDLGLPIRALDYHEYYSKITNGVINDYEFYKDDSDFKIADNRLDEDIVNKIVQSLNQLFVNVNTGTMQRYLGIAPAKESLDKTVQNYIETTGDTSLDSHDFLNYINSQSAAEAKQTKHTIDELGKIFYYLKISGLNKREITYAKNIFIKNIKPDNLNTKQFLDIVNTASKKIITLASASN